MQNCMTVLQEFQSTLPQGERRHPRSVNFRTRRISIHAPTRGATVIPSGTITEIGISIHAPTRGATESIRTRLFVE